MINEDLLPEQLYYGRRVNHFNVDTHYNHAIMGVGCEATNGRNYSENLKALEVSTLGRSDFKDPSFLLKFNDSTTICDFKYKGYEFRAVVEDGLPRILQDEQLVIMLIDEKRNIQLELKYTVLEDVDVITRSASVVNLSDETIEIEKLMSFNLDLFMDDMDIVSFHGKWIKERELSREALGYGKFQLQSHRGVSSANQNPGFLVCETKATEDSGDCYGFNLMYSGNHLETVEKVTENITRIQSGINPVNFNWTLVAGETFHTPSSTLTFSNEGLNGVSRNMHAFVNQYLINKNWQNKVRPIVFNTWEAMYFDFNESKLLKFAKAGKKLGLECFVLDDGWFGARNNDKTSLGDWFEDPKKLPNGLKPLVEKIHEMDLQFGLWFEPEMISKESELYKKHPEWAVAHPTYEVIEGRHQLILDFCNQDVIDYIYERMSSIIRETNLDYIKWDFNRPFTDQYSSVLGNRQGEFFHRYMLGVYQLLDRLTKEFPNVLFEGCASGGNRFDYGMLYYTPQIWTSDNTDVHSRMKIQYATSYLYPQSTMGAHVGANPNHQLLRDNPIEYRFNIAAFGGFGYELNLLTLSNFETKVIKKQVEFFKEKRKTLQFGAFTRLQSPYDSNYCSWQVQDDNETLLLHGHITSRPNPEFEKIYIKGLDENKEYEVSNRLQYINIERFGDLINHVLPVKIKTTGAVGLIHKAATENYMFETEVMNRVGYGDELMYAGVVLNQLFMGTSQHEDARIMGDFGSRIYLIKEVN
jgi:alpha-galactosidase